MIEFAKNYLTQKTTYLGLFKVLAALGIFTLAPELEGSIADSLVNVATGVLGLVGAFLVIKDERK